MRAMYLQNARSAVMMAALTFLVSLPILGVRLEQSAAGLSLSGEWLHSVVAALAVFAAQLALPVFNLAQRVHPRFQPSRYLESHRGWVLAGLILVGCLIPLWGSRATIDIATLALIYVLLGLGLNVVVGFAGLLDLGYVGFYAVGAYTCAILTTQFGWGFWSALPLAALLAGISGILLGFPVLRLRGDYLAIVTLGFGEIIRILLNNLDALTNGPAGISDIPAPTLFGLTFVRRPPQGETAFHEWMGIAFSSEHRLIFLYVIIFAICLISLWAINRLLRMPVGRAWEALREDEIACRSLGLNPTMVKLSAFAIGALFAGVAGALFAAKQGFVDPESFTFIESAIVLAIVVLGGMGSQVGVILAAIAFTVLPEVAREFSEYRMLVFGAVMVVMMVWRPQGLIPAQRPKLELPE